jgi:hypothetical protein
MASPHCSALVHSLFLLKHQQWSKLAKLDSFLLRQWQRGTQGSNLPLIVYMAGIISQSWYFALSESTKWHGKGNIYLPPPRVHTVTELSKMRYSLPYRYIVHCTSISTFVLACLVPFIFITTYLTTDNIWSKWCFTLLFPHQFLEILYTSLYWHHIMSCQLMKSLRI